MFGPLDGLGCCAAQPSTQEPVDETLAALVSARIGEISPASTSRRLTARTRTLGRRPGTQESPAPGSLQNILRSIPLLATKPLSAILFVSPNTRCESCGK